MYRTVGSADLHDMSTLDDDAGAADAVPPGASGAVPHRLGAPATPRRSGAEAPPGTSAYLAPPPRPTATGLRWDNPGGWRRSSATTFGLPGRIVATTILLAFVLWMFLNNPLMAPIGLGVLLWALRDVWAKAPVRRPEPPATPHAASRASEGAAIGWPSAQLLHDPVPPAPQDLPGRSVS